MHDAEFVADGVGVNGGVVAADVTVNFEHESAKMDQSVNFDLEVVDDDIEMSSPAASFYLELCTTGFNASLELRSDDLAAEGTLLLLLD